MNTNYSPSSQTSRREFIKTLLPLTVAFATGFKPNLLITKDKSPVICDQFNLTSILDSEKKYIKNLNVNYNWSHAKNSLRKFQKNAFNNYYSKERASLDTQNAIVTALETFYENSLSGKFTFARTNLLYEIFTSQKIDCDMIAYLSADYLVRIGVDPKRIKFVKCTSVNGYAGSHLLISVDGVYYDFVYDNNKKITDTDKYNNFLPIVRSNEHMDILFNGVITYDITQFPANINYHGIINYSNNYVHEVISDFILNKNKDQNILFNWLNIVIQCSKNAEELILSSYKHAPSSSDLYLSAEAYMNTFMLYRLAYDASNPKLNSLSTQVAKYLEASLRCLESSIKLFENVNSYYLRSTIYAQLGMYDNAITDILKAIDLAQDDITKKEFESLLSTYRSEKDLLERAKSK